jgi:hypothetical protein
MRASPCRLFNSSTSSGGISCPRAALLDIASIVGGENLDVGPNFFKKFFGNFLPVFKEGVGVFL